jgi:hypothetical protein
MLQKYTSASCDCLFLPSRFSAFFWLLFAPHLQILHIDEGHLLLSLLQVLVAGLLKHVKTVEPPSGSYADLLLKTKDAKTGALTQHFSP